MRWDAGWYYRIASVGYHWDPLETGQQNIAFFPAYPLTMRVVARLFGGSDMAYVFAGIAVSHVAFAWSLLLLYQLARATIGDEDAARGAVLLIA
jgi:Gpi18-like mannosyltransferase